MSYPIVGVKTGINFNTGALPLRQEIDTWMTTNPDQLNLYLQALAKLQATDQRDWLSYFQIAGIHGEPFGPWPLGDQSQQPDPSTQWDGYCAHATVLFPTWHRPYLALFEQVLHDIMNGIVQQYPDPALQQKYQVAADTFRLPYWDSAQLRLRNGQKTLAVPILVTQPTVSVLTPTGTQTIPNPLYRYVFKPSPAGLTSIQDNGNLYPFDSVHGTSRRPPPLTTQSSNPVQSKAWDAGVENNNDITNVLHNLTSFGEDVKNTLTLTNYLWVSSSAQVSPPRPDSYASIEDIHNRIHDITGGGGNMSWPTVSAHDPIFWLHHAMFLTRNRNIDRLFAIWQALNPNDGTNPRAWFDNIGLNDNGGTWSVPNGNYDTASTPLMPFCKDNNFTPYTSNDIQDWTTLGYSYPELQAWLPKYQVNGQFSYDTYVNDINTQINSLYARTRARFGGSVTGLAVTPAFQSKIFAGQAARAGTVASTITSIVGKAQNVLGSGQNKGQLQQPLNAPAGARQSGGTSGGLMATATSTAQSLASAASTAVQKGIQQGSALAASASTTHSREISSEETSSETTSRGIGSDSTSGHRSHHLLGHHDKKEKPQGQGLFATALATATTAMHQVQVAGQQAIASIQPEVHYHDFSVNARWERHALNGQPFTVHIFLGDFSPNPQDWALDPHRVGAVYNFVYGSRRGPDGKCGNCDRQGQESLVVTGQINITMALLDDMENINIPLHSIHPQEVEAYLIRNLHWRISTANGFEVTRNQLPSLKVSVVERVGTIPSNPAQSVSFSDMRVLHNVTDGRPCGLTPQDGY